MGGNGAVQGVAAGLQVEFHIGVMTRQHDSERANVGPAGGGADMEVVFVLAGVDELDEDTAGLSAWS